MSIEPFHLERYFADFEFETPVLFGASDCETTSVGALLDLDPAARERFEALPLSYTHSEGGREVRRAIAASYPARVGEDDILVHAAGVEVVTTLMLAALDPGDRVLVQAPCYQALRTAPEVAGAVVDRLETHPADGWRVTAEAVRAALTPRTRLVVLNSPHNPTGRVIEPSELAAIADLCAECGIRLFVDEAYRGTRFSGPIDEPSAVELGEHVAVLGLLSKGYGLPGLRLGWLVCRDRELRAAVERVKDYTTICAPAPSEFLAELAIRHRGVLLGRTRERLTTHLADLRELLEARADLFEWVAPDAGPITLPVVRPEAMKALGTAGDREVAERLRTEAGVLVIPGALFDAPAPSLRIGYGRANFGDGLQRFGEWLDRVVPV
ncbi:MAG: pyridoxal phosphate-dependent aminotransferase [Longimicrobiales bacterium]|nr:pyridoxal phosphate-dependent aminotransferase [Longimicrobiales bacterium]